MGSLLKEGSRALTSLSEPSEAPGGTRTHNLPFVRGLLYPLSYERSARNRSVSRDARAT